MGALLEGVTAVASGKVILIGEHAVVYGHPAVAIGIDRGARARVVSSSGDGPSQLIVRSWGIHVTEHDDHDLGRAFAGVLKLARRDGKPPHVVIEAEADLPPGGGLGCSAAVGVAIARAVEPHATREQLLSRAMAWESVFHGNPSGIDAAVSAHGGCVWFRRGNPVEHVAVRGNLMLCVGSTGYASSTKTMVESVAKLRATDPRRVDGAFEAMAALAHEAREAIQMSERVRLGRLMSEAQAHLERVGVSTKDIGKMCELAAGAGAFGVKLTGAGGGGCVVALVGNLAASEAVIEAWSRAGYYAFQARVSSAEPSVRRVLEEVSP